MTPPRAARPSQRIHERFSTLHSEAAKIIVRKPTEAAITRCDHSYTIPPTIGGVTDPQASGQVGTERPASLEVTRAPATSSKKVQQAVNTAYRCSPGSNGDSRPR